MQNQFYTRKHIAPAKTLILSEKLDQVAPPTESSKAVNQNITALLPDKLDFT